MLRNTKRSRHLNSHMNITLLPPSSQKTVLLVMSVLKVYIDGY